MHPELAITTTDMRVISRALKLIWLFEISVKNSLSFFCNTSLCIANCYPFGKMSVCLSLRFAADCIGGWSTVTNLINWRTFVLVADCRVKFIVSIFYTKFSWQLTLAGERIAPPCVCIGG